MFDNYVRDLITHPTDAAKRSCPTLLDASAIDAFLDWINLNTSFRHELSEQRTIRIGVLEHQLKIRQDWKDKKDRNDEIKEIGLRSQLQHLQIELLKFNPKSDETFINEVQRSYFGSDPTDRRSAELLVYGRKRNTDDGHVRVISRHRGFRVVSRVDVYVLNLSDIGEESDTSFWHAFFALDLHTKVVQVSRNRLENHDYPFAIVEAVKTLFGEIQRIIETSHPELAKLDGYQLIHQAFDGAPAKGKDPERTPKIQLNALVKDSEWSEQKGFRDIGCGAASAIRNPISHHEVEEAFIRERFGDRRTALKFLCMLSLLFEKLDKRVSP